MRIYLQPENAVFKLLFNLPAENC